MELLKAYKNENLIIQEVENANHFFRRFMGLMYRKSLAENRGLLLTPCDEIHTFGMNKRITFFQATFKILVHITHDGYVYSTLMIIVKKMDNPIID